MSEPAHAVDAPAETKISRRVRIDVDGERMTVTVPRAELAVVLGFLVAVLCIIVELSAPYVLRKAAPVARSVQTSGASVLPPRVPFDADDSATRIDTIELLEKFGPMVPVPLGFLVFLICRRSFRVRIVLDRAANRLTRGGRVECALSDVECVELDDAPRAFVMNTLALVLPADRRLTLLAYDPSTDSALFRKAEAIATFAGVPLKAKMGVRPRRR